jgi:hypothetical protein
MTKQKINLKKLTAHILLFIMIFNIVIMFKTDKVEAMASGVGDTKYPSDQAEYVEMLERLGVATQSTNGYTADFDTYDTRNLVVYGTHSDVPTTPNEQFPAGQTQKQSGGQWRYLGYTQFGIGYTNREYPNLGGDDASLIDDPHGWKYTINDINEQSWQNITDYQKQKMFEKPLTGNQVEDDYAPFYLSHIGKDNRYRLILSPPTLNADGSVKVNFTRDGSPRYATFRIPKLEGSIAVKAKLSTPQKTYTIGSAYDSVTIEIHSTSEAVMTTPVTASQIKKMTNKLEVASKGGYTPTYTNTVQAVSNPQLTQKQYITLSRSDFPVGTHTVNFRCIAEIASLFGDVDNDVALGSNIGGITLVVEPKVSPTANIYTDLVITPNPNQLLEGTSAKINLTLDASKSATDTGGALAFRYWVDTSPSFSNAGTGVNPANELTPPDTTPQIYNTSLNNVSAGSTIYARVKVYDFITNTSATCDRQIQIGEIPAELQASLDMDAPSTVGWKPQEWEDNKPKTVTIRFDASDSYGNRSISDYSYSLNGSGISGSGSMVNKSVTLYPSDVEASGGYSFSGEVTVEDSGGLTSTAEASVFIMSEIINTEPEVDFTLTSKGDYYSKSKYYATSPIAVDNQTWDDEDNIIYGQWTITDSSNNIVYVSQNDLQTNTDNESSTPTYFENSTLDFDGGELTFLRSGSYTIKYEAYDSMDLSGSKSKVITVMSEPQPPEANFIMSTIGYPNVNVTVTDASTDPNGVSDINQRIWTKPTINKTDGTPAVLTGTLAGSGGTLKFTNEGTYDVILKAIDNTKLESTKTREIKIIPPMATADFSIGGTKKLNRKVTITEQIDSSTSPPVDPIQTNRNIWTITPMDGQNPTSIKIDDATSSLTVKNVLFKQTGRYKVKLKVHNNFSDANPTHPYITATEKEEIITIEDDIVPVSQFTVTGSNPNFAVNPTNTSVVLKGTSYSTDADIISKYDYTVYRDINENGNFNDDAVYATYTTTNPTIVVNFLQGCSGMFKVVQKSTEEFGQATIDKYVTSTERKWSETSQTFSVNWQPDIKFDIPDWAYTDDTLNLTTVLKDEEINTLNVTWTLKKANTVNPTIMNSVTLASQTDNFLDNNGGSIRYKNSGYYELIATVRDEIGQTFTYSDTIRIYPLPTAVITDSMTFGGVPFTTKENRKYLLDGNSSYANDYYGAELHAIDHTKDVWEIIPMNGQDATQVIKVDNGSGGSLANDTPVPSKYTKSSNQLNEQLLFKQKGKYKIRYRITNVYGKQSPWLEKEITVVEDKIPVMSFVAENLAYRDPADTNKALLVTHSISAISSDSDTIALKRIRYRFDSNNNGSFTDETWSSSIPIDTTTNMATAKVTHVGKYEFEFYSQEEFGQATLPQFVTTADRERNYQYKVIEVDNVRPTVDFSIVPRNKVDVVFTVGNADKAKLTSLNTKINTYVKTELESNATDLVDAYIETIETSTIDIQNSFTWTKYDHSRGSISGTNIRFNGYQDKGYNDFWYNDDQTPSNKTFSFILDENNVSYHSFFGGGFLFNMKKEAGSFKGYALLLTSNQISIYSVNAPSEASLSTNENKSYFTLLTSATKTYGVHDIVVDASATTVKVRDNGTMKIDYTLPQAQGYGFAPIACHNDHNCSETSTFYFKNLVMESGMIKTLDEVLNMPAWRENTTKILVNISDTTLPELNGVAMEQGKVYSATSSTANETNKYIDFRTNFKKEDFTQMIFNTVAPSNGYSPRVYFYVSSDGVNWSDGIKGNVIAGGAGINGNTTTRQTTYSLAGSALPVQNIRYIRAYDPNARLNTFTATTTFSATAMEAKGKSTVVVSRMLDDTMYFAELGTTVNQAQAEMFIDTISDRGTFIRNDNPNMDKALQDLADWILDLLRATPKPTSKYVLLNDAVSYNLYYNDYENDPQYNWSRWKYDHNSTYFNNSLGVAPYSNQWLANSINSFDKVGKFTTTYETKDNPVGADNRFDLYRKVSEMMSGALNIFVHRKPIAQFIANVTKVTTGTDKIYTQSEIDFTGEGDTYAHWNPLFTAPSGTIKTIEFRTPSATDDYWHGATYLYVEAYKTGSWTKIKTYESYHGIQSPIQDTIDVSGQGYTQVRFYFRMRDSSDSAQGNPTGSYYKITTLESEQTGFSVTYANNSYDLDHQSLTAGYYKLDSNYNLLSATSSTGTYVNAKGIVAVEWQWKEVNEATWHNGQFTGGETTKDYLVKLRVRDMDGDNFLGAWSDDKIVLITNNPLPPIAQFNLDKYVLPLGSTLTITDSSYDPNGDAIAQWEWKLYKGTSATPLATYNVTNPQTNVNTALTANGIGDYKLTLQIRDNTGAWGNVKATSAIFTQEFTVIPVNHTPEVEFTPVGNNGSYTLPSNVITIFGAMNWFGKAVGLTPRDGASDPDADNTGFDLKWTLERYLGTDMNVIASGVPTNTYTYAGSVATTYTSANPYKGSVPFAGSFESNGLPYGAYRITFEAKDRPPIPPYQPIDAITDYVSKNIYVLPRLTMTPTWTGTPINGNTITFRATTNEHVTSVSVNFLGQTLWMNLQSQSGGNKYWEKEFVIPLANTSLGARTATYRAYCNYANVGSNYYITDTTTSIFVKPILTIIGSFTGNPITGETITLKAQTSRYDGNNISVNVNFLGQNLAMTKVNTIGDVIYWERNFTIPDTVTDSANYPATFTATDPAYAVTATDIINIYVVTLKLTDFVVTDIVNHTNYSYPLLRVNLPVDYRAGYYITFQIKAKGNPTTVKSRVYTDSVFDEEINMIQVGVSGTDTIWEGKYYSNPRLTNGTYINMFLTAQKGVTTYDYNAKEGWDGRVARINGTVLQDARINRTN